MEDRPRRAAGLPDPIPGEPDAAGALVEAWLGDLPGTDEECGPARAPELLRAYHTLGSALLDVAFEGPVPRGGWDALRERAPDLDHLVATVTALQRKSGVTISQTLEDVYRLAPASLEWLRSASVVGEAPEQVSDPLRLAESIVVAVSGATAQLARLLEASASRAQREESEALAAMTEVLSHELSNRLGAAGTASEMLSNPDIDLNEAQLARAARLVRLSVQDALRTVEDVRSLAATRTDVAARHVRPTELPALIRSVVNEVQPMAQEAGVELSVDDDLEACQVDASRLRLILFNLAGNGIKYRDPGEASPRVWIETEMDEDGCLEIRVRDNGVGIEPEHLEDIFEYRVRGGQSERTSGSGLGLAIAREAAEQMGGTLSVESEPGVGSTFILRVAALDSAETG